MLFINNTKLNKTIVIDDNVTGCRKTPNVG